MQEEALADARARRRRRRRTRTRSCLFRPEWHQGVVGIVASRLKDRYHRPAIVFARGGGGELKGSGRSIAGFHLRDALDLVDKREPGLIVPLRRPRVRRGPDAGRGRPAALRRGVRGGRPRAADARAMLARTLETDGALAAGRADARRSPRRCATAVWGQGFPAPVFDDAFAVAGQRIVGGEPLQARRSRAAAERFDAILFRHAEPLPRAIRAAYPAGRQRVERRRRAAARHRALAAGLTGASVHRGRAARRSPQPHRIRRSAHRSAEARLTGSAPAGGSWYATHLIYSMFVQYSPEPAPGIRSTNVELCDAAYSAIIAPGPDVRTGRASQQYPSGGHTMRLRDKVAIITGAGSGIGQATAVKFAHEGAKVAVCDINEASGAGVGRRRSSTAAARRSRFLVDVTDKDSIARMVEGVMAAWGRIDTLVNNAGHRPGRAVQEDDRGPVRPRHRRQPEGRLQLHQGGRRHHAGAELGLHPQRVVDRRPLRQLRPDQLRRDQVRRDRHGRRPGRASSAARASAPTRSARASSRRRS